MKYATILVSVLIVIAVLIPGPNLPDIRIGGYDKVIHIVMFTVWMLAVRFDYGDRPFPWLFTFAAGIAFSALTEVLQILVEGRTFDYYDLAADAVGMVIGLAISKPVVRWLHKFM